MLIKRLLIFLLVLSLGVIIPNNVFANYIYWVDNATGKIQKANLDGSGATDILTEVITPFGLVVDEPNGRMYWTSDGMSRIQRANLDGTDLVNLIELTGGSPAGPMPYGICLDDNAGKIYWADGNSGKIQRANSDGTNLEDIVTELNMPEAVALDLSGGHLYWTEMVSGRDGVIRRANLDGTGMIDLVTGLSYSYGLALDLNGGHMYWTNYFDDKIQRANLDGTGVVDLVTELSQPSGIALNLNGGHMYWTDVLDGKIYRANLDGTGMMSIVAGQINPVGIVVSITTPTCTDGDGDSYAKEGGICGPVDCDDNNAEINPEATEICDGKDNNCNGEIDEDACIADGDVNGDCNITSQDALMTFQYYLEMITLSECQQTHADVNLDGFIYPYRRPVYFSEIPGPAVVFG